MAGKTNWYHIKPVFFAISVMVMVLICLPATIKAWQSAWMWQAVASFVIYYFALNGLPGPDFIKIFLLLITICFFPSQLTTLSLFILFGSSNGFFSNPWTTMIPGPYVAIFEILTNAVQSIRAIGIFIKILNGLWLPSIGAIWTITYFHFNL